jgi:hypothetical protein
VEKVSADLSLMQVAEAAKILADWQGEVIYGQRKPELITSLIH